MWRRIIWYKFTDDSEEPAATSVQSGAWLLLVYVAYSSILKMEAVRSSETSVKFISLYGITSHTTAVVDIRDNDGSIVYLKNILGT
jgi:hypothetical protein